MKKVGYLKKKHWKFCDLVDWVSLINVIVYLQFMIPWTKTQTSETLPLKIIKKISGLKRIGSGDLSYDKRAF